MDNQNSYEYQKNLDEYYYGNNMHMSGSMNDNVNYMLPHNGKQHSMDTSHLPPQPIPLHQPQPHPHLHQPYQPTNLPPTLDHHPQAYSMQHLPAPMYHQIHPPVLAMHPHQMPSYPLNYQTDPTGRLQDLPQTQPADLTPKSVITNTESQINSYNTSIREPVTRERIVEPPQVQAPVPIQVPVPEQTHTQQEVSHNTPMEIAPNVPQNHPQAHEMPSEAINQTFTPIPQEEIPYKPRPSMLSRVITNSPMCPKKKRRRIVQLNDEDSDDNTNELKRELLNKSPVLETEPRKVDEQAPGVDPEHPQDKQKEESEDSSEDSSEESEPGVITDPEAIREHQARSLLKSAVIIQAAEKKKKVRVLDSDDEEQQLTNVDDIGIESNEPEEEPFDDSILMCETDNNYESLEIDKSEKVIPIENPIIPQEDPPEDSAGIDQPTAGDETADKDEIVDRKPKIEAIVKREITENEETATPSPASIKLKKIKSENVDDDIDPAGNVEAILEKDKNSSDDEFIPNDEYFGDPNLQVAKPHAPRRSSSNRSKVVKRKRRDEYEKETSSESSVSESSYSESDSSESSEDNRPRMKPNRAIPRPIMKPAARPISIKPQFSLANMQNFRRAIPPPKRKVVKDRFYDRSRDIPNDVYFGDVKVPLHVLHTRWGSDASDSSSSDSSDERVPYARFTPMVRNMRPVGKMMMKPRRPMPTIPRPAQGPRPSSSSSQPQTLDEDPKLSIYKNFIKVAGIKVNYGRLFEGIMSADDKCILLRRVLASKGLQGEPTIAKCKQLKLDLQTKKEIADLDTSVIITEGRTRRSTGRMNKTSSRSSGNTSLQPETLQTLSKIRRVIDSDSE